MVFWQLAGSPCTRSNLHLDVVPLTALQEEFWFSQWRTWDEGVLHVSHLKGRQIQSRIRLLNAQEIPLHPGDWPPYPMQDLLRALTIVPKGNRPFQVSHQKSEVVQGHGISLTLGHTRKDVMCQCPPLRASQMIYPSAPE